MIHSLQGLMCFECCEINKEELLLRFVSNSTIVTRNSYFKKSSNTYCKLLSYFFHLFIFQLQPVENLCNLISIHFNYFFAVIITQISNSKNIIQQNTVIRVQNTILLNVCINSNMLHKWLFLHYLVFKTLSLYFF